MAHVVYCKSIDPGFFVLFVCVYLRASFMSKSLTVDSYTIKFQIWDTAGQERVSPLKLNKVSIPGMLMGSISSIVLNIAIPQTIS